MAVAERAPILWVSAGLNWAGKSSIVGERIRQSGADYFNPDEIARRLRELQPGLVPERANELAWKQGKRLLEESIAARRSFAFETTLGGRTISRLLHAAIDVVFEVRMWFLALESADRHVELVRARVVEGHRRRGPRRAEAIAAIVASFPAPLAPRAGDAGATLPAAQQQPH